MAKQESKQSDGDSDVRSAYPLYGIKKSIQIGQVVADLGGAKVSVQKSLIAQNLQLDESSAVLNQTLSSSKAFGLIVGRGSYRLTEIGVKYFHPADHEEKQRALLAAIKMPTIFESLINRFDGGRVPAPESLVNIIKRDHQVTDSWQPRVAALFLSSLRDTHLIDGGNFLRYRASLDGGIAGGTSPATIIMPQAPSVPSAPQPYQQNPLPQSGALAGVRGDGDAKTTWSHKGLRVDTPDPLSFELWKRLADYVNVLKPDAQSETALLTDRDL